MPDNPSDTRRRSPAASERRRLLRGFAFAGLAGVLSAAPRSASGRAAPIPPADTSSITSRRPEEGAAQPPDSDLTFVDAHVHLNDPAMHLRLMDGFALSQAHVFWGGASDNEALVAAARAFSDRFIPWVSVSPERRSYRGLWERPPAALLAELERLVQTGAFRGIGEISVVHFPGDGFPEADYDPLGPHMVGIMTIASRHRLPVNIHCEITRLREFSELVARFRDVTVIWAHGGYTPYFLAQRMLAQHPNLIYELSARTWDSHPRSPDYTIFRNETTVWPAWLDLIEAYSDRFLVGTDASHRSEEADRRKIERVRLLIAQLPGDSRSFVAHRNIARILDR